MIPPFYLLLILLRFFSSINAQNVNITIPLNKTITEADKELYGDFFTINHNSTLQVSLEKVNKNVTFFVFQAHCHLYNITVYNNSLVQHSYISGRNIGLYGLAKKPYDTYYILNGNEMDLKVYISIHGYSKQDPIPGGGNLEFPINISPFMYAHHNRHYIDVDAQVAISASGNLTTEMVFYRMYLPEREFDEDTYFEGIRNMMTKAKILDNGIEVPQSIPKMPMRRMLNAYAGTGSVFVAIAYQNNNYSLYSVYVPTTSYACSPLVEGDCQLLNDITTQLFCASLLFIGLFTCYFGHRFFKTEMFLVGMFTGLIFSYIMISLMQDLEPQALLCASIISGIFFGAIWLLFWWFYGIPVVAVFLSTLQLGFLCSAIIYYRIPGHPLLIQNVSFWSLFLMIMILTSLVLLTAAFLSNILCCAVLGAYATVFAIDNYLGSSLRYIVINTVRRAVVDKFNFVEIAAPFQWRDVLVTLIWVLLATSGFLLQHYHNRGRSPFPPPPRSISPRMPGTPIFTRQNRTRYGVIGGEESSTLPVATEPVVGDERSPLL